MLLKSVCLFQGYFQSEIDNIQKNSDKTPQSELINLIPGGVKMKYRNVSIIKHKNCNTWYARFRCNGKQHYISAKTQQDCYDKLKKSLNSKSFWKNKKSKTKKL